MSRTWKQGLLTLPGVGVSVLPKLVCPACWPAYAGLLSSVGLSFLISTVYLLPLTAAFLILAVATLGFRAGNRHGYGPLAVGSAAAIGLLIGKFRLDSSTATYGSLAFLVAASIWNSWPRRKSQMIVCPDCLMVKKTQ